MSKTIHIFFSWPGRVSSVGNVQPTKEVAKGRGGQSWKGTEGVDSEPSSWIPRAGTASQRIWG